MVLFLIGIAILIVGGYLYGNYVDKVFGPDDRPTPANTKADGVDYVVMRSWKNELVELLNIAGTGPVLGPIQGILFGPIAFLTIPIGCVLAGSVHDYFIGMISMRNGGAQIPNLINKYLGPGVKKFYNVVITLLLLLTGVVFVYTPGDLIVGDIMKKDASSSIIWVVYGFIFLYYLLATLFPIDAIIGRIYPIFGAFLIISALGIFGGILLSGGAGLHALTQSPLLGLFDIHPTGQMFIPAFFITVACGIMSGFHGSQATLISRTVGNEREGKKTFYNMMLAEGFIAMCWAGGAIVLFNLLAQTKGAEAFATGATPMVGIISRHFMGNVGGLLAIVGVIVLPITSGDTCFRSLRLIFAEQFNIDQRKAKNRLMLSSLIFIPAILILFFAKSNKGGFNLLWRYFGFTNQFVAVFALAFITVYLKTYGKNYLMTLIPGAFYSFIVMSFISHAPIGLNLESLLGLQQAGAPDVYSVSYVVGIIFAVLFVIGTLKIADKRKELILKEDK